MNCTSVVYNGLPGPLSARDRRPLPHPRPARSHLGFATVQPVCPRGADVCPGRPPLQLRLHLLLPGPRGQGPGQLPAVPAPPAAPPAAPLALHSPHRRPVARLSPAQAPLPRGHFPPRTQTRQRQTATRARPRWAAGWTLARPDGGWRTLSRRPRGMGRSPTDVARRQKRPKPQRANPPDAKCVPPKCRRNTFGFYPSISHLNGEKELFSGTWSIYGELTLNSAYKNVKA